VTTHGPEPTAGSGVPVEEIAGTPPAFGTSWGADGLATIEFAAARELVAAMAAGPLGAERVRARVPSEVVPWIREELAAVGEAMTLLAQGEALRVDGVPDVRRALARARLEGSVLDGRDLAALGRMLVAARALRADLRRLAEAAPRVGALAVELPPPALEARLEQSLEPDGELRDAASPRLHAARREVHVARERLVRRLEAILRGLGGAAAGDGVTMRGDRYVIPVRRDARTRPAGIVHDESGSAGTLFIEPTEAVELGNALREAQAEAEREALRVLQELTALVRPEAARCAAALEMCIAADDLQARARVALEWRAAVPAVAPSPGPLTLMGCRHPLLLAQGAAPVVPFDLDLEPHERTLVVSGPNTGGKTVLLKATALAVALAQSGIVPPVMPGTRLPVFRRCFADIGDRQSIEANLSTFSAHVVAVREILAVADEATLVLVDEIGSGTDPVEGGALAAAVLRALTRRGATTLATTHLGALKPLATTEPGVVNGSLEFDEATLRPTYRFRKGVPGRSYGLAIARRLGLPGPLLDEAEARVPGAERALEELLARTERRARELDLEAGRLAAQAAEQAGREARLVAEQQALADRERQLRERERALERDGQAVARRYLLDARRRVEAALAEASAAADEARAREARRLVEDGVRALSAPPAGPAPATPAATVPVGAQVRAPGGGTGTVLEVRADGTLVLAMGSVKVVVEAAGIEVLAAGRPGARPRGAAGRPPATGSRPAAEPRLEVDLRGLTGDEAEAATIAAVDAAVLAEQPFLRIIHGMGTGVVRDRVRRVVEGDPRVASCAYAPREQGGVGVTIVEFR